MNCIHQKTKQTASRISFRNESGQALVEFSLVMLALLVLLFGAIDFCRAIYLRQLLVNLTRETANLEARGSGSTTTDIMTNALSAAITEALPSLALNSENGMIIITAVTNTNGVPMISQQYFAGTLSIVRSPPSQMGGPAGNPATMPSIPGVSILPANRTLYVAEIYYKFVPITPVGNFINAFLPKQFYDAAFFSAL